MNVQALVVPINISAGILVVETKLRFADGSKSMSRQEVPVNFANPLKPQVATFLQGVATAAGHTLTNVLWPDLSVSVL
jgi:hypothetical protein